MTAGPQATVVAGSEDGKVYMWDLQTKQLLQTLEGHTDVVLGVSCHPSKEMIVTGGTDKDLRSIRIWERETDQPRSATAAMAPPPPAPLPTPPGAALAAAAPATAPDAQAAK